MRVEWHEAPTVAGRHPPPRLIPSRRSVAPISEDRERPRNHFRGRFPFQRPQKRVPAHARDVSRRGRFRPRVSQPIDFRSITARTHGHRGPHAGRRCRGIPPRGAQALHRDARCGQRRETHGHTDCRSTRPAMRCIDRTVSSGAGSHPARCARHCRGACRSPDTMHRQDDIGSTGERRRKPQVAGSIPACRSTWIAQWLSTGSRIQGCGFDSRSKP